MFSKFYYMLPPAAAATFIKNPALQKKLLSMNQHDFSKKFNLNQFHKRVKNFKKNKSMVIIGGIVSCVIIICIVLLIVVGVLYKMYYSDNKDKDKDKSNNK